MKNSDNSILAVMAIQHSGGGSSNLIFDKESPQLKSLWIEIPDYCHLRCEYCFASTEEKPKEDMRSSYLSWNEYEKILWEFAVLGGKFVGIPGKGEPFHNKNWELTEKIIRLCEKLALELAIFTTGDAIFFDPSDSIDAEPKYHKIDILKDRDVILLIKCNSLNHDVQNELVSKIGKDGKSVNQKYAQLRERTLNLLMNEYHLNDQHRLGVVTSVLKKNKDEINDLYTWAKDNRIIFDCDTILERGRGKSFVKDENVPSKTELESVFKNLKEVGAVTNCQGGTYVGCTCDRIFHHLYVSVTGEIYPCIGCLKEDLKEKFMLGNIRKNSLQNAWEKPLRHRLAYKHKDVIRGTCRKCQNFIDESCYSCLGRCVSRVDEKGIHTHGCIHHRPSTTVWLVKAVDYTRSILSFESTKKSIKEHGLEYLWQPNKNIAYSLQQLNDKNRKDVIALFFKTEAPQKNNDFQIKQLKTGTYSKKKHYYIDDIEFPINTAWDFISFPHKVIDRERDQLTEENEARLIDAFSYAFLSNIFIPSVMILLRRYDKSDTLVKFINFMLYDNVKETYFYRSFSRGSKMKDPRSDEIIQPLIISRWADNFSQRENLWGNKCMDLSDFFADKFYSNYTLKLADPESSDNFRQSFDENHLFFDLTEIVSMPGIQERANKFIHYVSLNNPSFIADFEKVKYIINEKIFAKLTIEEEKNMKELYNNINNNVFFGEKDKKKKYYEDLQEDILKILSKIKISQSQKDKIWTAFQNVADGKIKLLNYFVYLAILKEALKANYYNIIYSANFSENSVADKNNTLKPNGMLIYTASPLDTDFRSKLSLYMSYLSAPFDEFYHKELFIEKYASNKILERIESHRHTLKNFMRPLYNYLDTVTMDKFGENGLKRLGIIIEDMIDNQKIKYNLPNAPDAILNEVCDLFNSGNNIIIADYKIFGCHISMDIVKSAIQLKGIANIDYFTVIFNLIHNAVTVASNENTKRSIDSDVIIKTLMKENHYEIIISNIGLISDNKKNFINGENQDPTIKSTSGLAISKRLAMDYGWKLLCDKMENDNKTIFTIKIR